MKIEKTLIISFVAPLMILLSIIGFVSSQNHKRIFYLPIGLMGICIILEKVVSRTIKRKMILKKIKSYQKIE